MKIYVFFILFVASVSAAATEKNIDVNVSTEGRGCDIYLSIQFVNRFDAAITVNLDWLPWANSSHGMEMFLYGWDGAIYSGLLTMAGSVDPERVSLLPGKMLIGRIRLKDTFPDFVKVMSDRDMTLYWRYTFYEKQKAVHILKVGAVHLNECK